MELYDPAIPLLGLYPKKIESRGSNRYLHTNVHRSNGQKVETSQMSINRLMDKQNVVYTYNVILFSLKRIEILTHAIMNFENIC